MIIRNDQMAMFGAAAHRAYVQAMTRYLAKVVPDAIAGRDAGAIAEEIEAAERYCERYGFRSERSVSIFVELWFRYGARFELSPAFAPVLALLHHPAGPPDAKADLLLRHHQALRGAGKAQ